jgi:hypothetical protein
MSASFIGMKNNSFGSSARKYDFIDKDDDGSFGEFCGIFFGFLESVSEERFRVAFEAGEQLCGFDMKDPSSALWW